MGSSFAGARCLEKQKHWSIKDIIFLQARKLSKKLILGLEITGCHHLVTERCGEIWARELEMDLWSSPTQKTMKIPPECRCECKSDPLGGVNVIKEEWMEVRQFILKSETLMKDISLGGEQMMFLKKSRAQSPASRTRTFNCSYQTLPLEGSRIGRSRGQGSVLRSLWWYFGIRTWGALGQLGDFP